MSGLIHDGLSDLAVDIATAGFGALWDGRSVRPEDLVPVHSRRARRATAELVERGRAEVDDHGRIVGVHGLTMRQTRHHFVHAGRPHQTWCAFDSIGIPAALAVDAEARTTCPSCDGALQVPIRGGHPETSGIALWLPSGTIRHLMVDFCSAADLYCGRDHLERRIDPAWDPGQVLDLASAATLGRAAWADVAGRSLGLEHGPC